jgi:DNA topoisomerase-3
MYKRVFIAEKPNLGRAIAAGLERTNPGARVAAKTDGPNGYIEVGDDAVTWCWGHFLELVQPEGYDERFRVWNESVLPIIPDVFRVEPKCDPKTRKPVPIIAKQLKIIKDLLKNCKIVVNGGDPEREGQVIIDEVLEFYNYKGESQRIWLASLDDKSVANALATLKNNLDPVYVNLRNAALARARVDWLAGINLTRAMTVFGRSRGLTGVLSIGRVQTPTLALVVQRDRDIENFTPQDYAVIQAEISHEAGSFTAVFNIPKDMDGMDPEGRITDFRVAQAIADAAAGKPGVITRVERKKGSTPPPPPYKLSALQRDASSRFSMGAQEVLDIAQSLYEGKLTTYPRTDCEFLPEEQFDGAGEILANLAGIDEFAEMAGGANPAIRSRAWNTGKITAHHAIIPTGVMPKNLKQGERNLYHLIARNYILQFWPDEVHETQKIVLVIDGKTQWTANGRVVLSPGFRAHMPGDAKDRPLPAGINKDDPCHCLKAEALRKKTSPPARFTEGTLIDAMEYIHKYVTDPKARAKLKETDGIGTNATRAGILETLKKRGYLAVSDKKKLTIMSTAIGRAVFDLAPPAIKDIAMTARLEDFLSGIAEGKYETGEIVGAYSKMLQPMIDAIFKSSGEAIRIKTHPCPSCGKALQLRKSKNGVFWACSGYPDCRYAAPDEKGKPGAQRAAAEISSEHMCPKCGKALARRDGKFGPWWGCTGYSTGCDYRARDDNGRPGESSAKMEQPVAKGKYSCPECGGKLLYKATRTGKNLFICENAKKHKSRKTRFFDDNSGEPVFERDVAGRSKP